MKITIPERKRLMTLRTYIGQGWDLVKEDERRDEGREVLDLYFKKP